MVENDTRKYKHVEDHLSIERISHPRIYKTSSDSRDDVLPYWDCYDYEVLMFFRKISKADNF